MVNKLLCLQFASSPSAPVLNMVLIRLHSHTEGGLEVTGPGVECISMTVYGQRKGQGVGQKRLAFPPTFMFLLPQRAVISGT